MYIHVVLFDVVVVRSASPPHYVYVYMSPPRHYSRVSIVSTRLVNFVSWRTMNLDYVHYVNHMNEGTL